MRKNAMRLFAVLIAASVVGVTGSVVVGADGPASERPIPSAAGGLPVVVSGRAEVRRAYGPDGREGFEVRLPAVHPGNPVSEVTLIKDGVPLTLRTLLLDPAPTQFGKSAPRDLSCSGGNPGYCVCHSELSTGASYFRTSMELWTYWNWDYSTVWTNAAQAYDPDANPPLHFEHTNLALSGLGTQYAYSDLHSDLKDGYG